MASSETSASKSPAESALDIFGKLFDTIAVIGQHQAAAQGATNTAEASGKPAAKSEAEKLSPLDTLTNLLTLGAAPAKGPDLLAAPPPPSGGGGGSGGKSSAEGLASIIKLLAMGG